MRVAFIHGRPKGHPTHAKYAKRVKSKFFHEDRLLRWHDRPKRSKMIRYFSWVLNALYFPRDYDVFLTECIRIPQLIMKKVGLINKKQKLIALMGDESLYFLTSRRYPALTRWLMIEFLKATDALICVGQFQADLAKLIVPNHKIRKVFNGVSEERYGTLSMLNPDLNSFNVLFIGNVEADWRVFYKGLDIAIQSIIHTHKFFPNLVLNIVGSENENLRKKYSQEIEQGIIKFHGRQANFSEILTECSLYLQPAKGEAWGISVNEAMMAGIPAIVSELTGAQELVRQVDEKLICESNIDSVVQKLHYYYQQPVKVKKELSEASRRISQHYLEKDAIITFEKEFMLAIS